MREDERIENIMERLMLEQAQARGGYECEWSGSGARLLSNRVENGEMRMSN